MASLFRTAGYTVVGAREPADVCVINTCTVTGTGAQKSRQQIRRARRENPGAVLAVTGCLAQTEANRLREDMDVDILLGNKYRNRIVELTELALRGIKTDQVADILKEDTFEEIGITHGQSRVRANLKIEDGCGNFCAYCIIPYARGPVRSRPLVRIREEAEALGEAGYGEVVLTGIHIGSYGRDLGGGTGLMDVIETVHQTEGIRRIRLGSLEPRTIDEAFCKTLSGYANLCPQFHLSLQSGSDTVLKRMHRKYDTARYLESVRLLRKYFPGCAVTTDLIVGFPGETEEEFAESLEFLKTCGLSMFHIFPYSRRKGTPAADMPDQIPNAVKERRAAEAASAAAELEAAYHASMLGTTQQVLFEQEENGLYAGHAMNYVKVYVQAAQLHNELRAVRVTDLCRDGVFGELE